MLFPTLWILPRLSESLHPGGQGSEGNPGINGKDMSASMRTGVLSSCDRLDFIRRLDKYFANTLSNY